MNNTENQPCVVVPTPADVASMLRTIKSSRALRAEVARVKARTSHVETPAKDIYSTESASE
jgi:hypothetical protein